MRIGVDIDGVLADFNKAFIKRVIDVTGKDRFPPRPFTITTWNYPEMYGYTKDQVSAVWENIKQDRLFWYLLTDYPDTFGDLEYLSTRVKLYQDDVYFITARPGVQAKHQTELWLDQRLRDASPFRSPILPTVLMTSHKGLAARTLGLDVYIDDRDTNCLDVANCGVRTFVCDRPWNNQPEQAESLAAAGVTRVTRVKGFAEAYMIAQPPPAATAVA
jgi:uncharacterized HAD superfamily protein